MVETGIVGIACTSAIVLRYVALITSDPSTYTLSMLSHGVDSMFGRLEINSGRLLRGVRSVFLNRGDETMFDE